MWSLTNDQQQQLFRLAAAASVGIVVGLDRHIRHKPAGVRTHGLVCLGSAAVTLGAIYAFPHANVVQALQGVVSGVGFLGAGLIVHAGQNNTVHGLTTAASLWFVASIGAILGFGSWFVSFTATLLGLLVLLFGGTLEKRLERLERLERGDKPERESDLSGGAQDDRL